MGVVPTEIREAVRAELERLVSGEYPEQLLWVHQYGSRGATIIVQPEEIWEHPWSDATQTNDGGWHVVIPLYTTDEAPSDLSAEIIVTPDGVAEVHDVHVL